MFLRLLGTRATAELLTPEVAQELLSERLPQLDATTASPTLVETQIHLMTKVCGSPIARLQTRCCCVRCGHARGPCDPWRVRFFQPQGHPEC